MLVVIEKFIYVDTIRLERGSASALLLNHIRNKKQSRTSGKAEKFRVLFEHELEIEEKVAYVCRQIYHQQCKKTLMIHKGLKCHDFS